MLGVSAVITVAGLFKTGIGWSREWESLRNAGTVPLDGGLSPILGTALAVLAGGAVLAVLFLHGEHVWRAFLNIRLAVTTLAAVGILSILGTMVVQRLGAGGLPEPERDFVAKFMKGQGGVPVNARFMVAPPEVVLSPAENEHVDLLGKAFGEGKARQMQLQLVGMHERGRKAEAIENHVKDRGAHLLRLFEKFEALGFTMVFRTWWFNSLLALLAVQIVALLVHRWPWPRAKAGWVTTHVGVLIVLVGCMVSDGFLRDGSLALTPGEYSSQFRETTRPLDAHGQAPLTDLGFRVVMWGTDQSFHHALQVEFPDVKTQAGELWTEEQLRVGRRIPVKDPGGKASYEIRILEVHERCLVETGMVSGARTGRADGVPALRLQFLDTGPGHEGHDHGGEGHLVDDGWIAAGGPEGEPVRYFAAATSDEAKGLIEGSGLRDEGRHGTVVVRVPGVPEPISVPATIGAKAVATGDAGAVWTIEVQRFYSRFTVEEMQKEQEDQALAGAAADDGASVSNPVLSISVKKAVPGGAEESSRTLAFGIPGLQAQWDAMVSGKDAHAPEAGTLGRGPAGECGFEYRYAPSSRIWIVEGPGIERTLVLHRRGEATETRPFAAAGTTVPLPGRPLALRLAEALPDAVPDLRITPMAQESDAEYLETCIRTLQTGQPPPLTASAARIEVVERDEAGERTRSEWLVAGRREFDGQRGQWLVLPRPFFSTDRRLVLAMTETKNSLMFRSAVEVQSLDGKPLLRDGKPFRTVVRVNHPLQWGGYAFYQNNFTPATASSGAVSVFRVKYDRGIPLVYTGFVVLTLGVCVMLYFDPFFRRKRPLAPAVQEA